MTPTNNGSNSSQRINNNSSIAEATEDGVGLGDRGGACVCV